MAAQSPIEPTLDGIAARPELAHQIARETAKRLQLDALAVALVLDQCGSLPSRLAKQICDVLTRARDADAEKPVKRVDGNRHRPKARASEIRQLREESNVDMLEWLKSRVERRRQEGAR